MYVLLLGFLTCRKDDDDDDDDDEMPEAFKKEFDHYMCLNSYPYITNI